MDTPPPPMSLCPACHAPLQTGAAHCGACGRSITGKMFSAATTPPKISHFQVEGAAPQPLDDAELAPHLPTGSYSEDDIARVAPGRVPHRPAVASGNALENALDAAFSDPVAEMVEGDRFAPGAAVLDQYRVVRQLGQGGMGAVYLARDDVTGQEVAVKVLPAELAKDKDLRERFSQEARALAALDHPNIVPLLTYATRGDDRYLVMKFVAGKSVDDLLSEQKRLDVEIATKIFRSVVEALGYAHSQGVIHRDVKPGNVLLSNEGRIFLVDFGIAKQEEGARITQTGILMGTPQYMSPEQISGQTIDGRSDLYAAGLLFFEMLAGVAPFTGEKTFAILRAHVESKPPDIRSFRKDDIPDVVVACIEALLEKDPKKRPQGAADVLKFLDGGVAFTPTPPPTGQPVTAMVPLEDQTAPITAAIEQPFFNTARIDAIAPPAKEPMAAIVMVLGLVAVILGGIFLWNYFQREAPPDVVDTPIPTVAEPTPAALARAKIVDKGAKELEQGDYESAISLAETVLSEEHDNIGAQALLVNAFIAKGSISKAKAAFVNLQVLATGKPSFDAKIDEKKAAIDALEAAKAERDAARERARNAKPKDLTPKQISAVTRSASSREQLQNCWERTVLTRNPKAKADVSLAAVISGSNGKVTEIKNVSSTIGDKRFIQCVRKVVNGWRFPEFQGKPIVVHYAGSFTGDSAAGKKRR